ncbi:MAG TPA: undecaprenyldiphospho-muramoylpentapeptide beta-N-acetylglucosaminyltransferase [Syntrophales bacterium]|nr:undecaprenyldiphospho-muramoylpentapeptide beta-N-acetylglucosaminyltransferase [Syntrophales bacterium]HPQ43452.1 undecaprenyldiphospho-muramoylpentapeptide beta-N-acetylglucosaminyltransferase [Syntrophales bacterium]
MERETKRIKIVLAGGGTGGHVFPAVAIAGEFLERETVRDVLFIGTERGLEARILHDMGFTLRTIRVEGLKGRGIVGVIGGMLKVPRSIAQSVSILRAFRPDIALGVGGYASGPAVIAAHFMGVKTAIAEQNALPGLTNRMLGRFVDRIFLTFPDGGRWFPDEKTVVTGNPVRREFLQGIKRSHRDGDTFSILIFGGSQGASAINRAVVDSMQYLNGMRDRLVITHQTGARDLEEVSAAYRHYGINAAVHPFITDMAAAYGSADLLICRAGATSIAEITASGKASVLIPYPFAAGGHQELNARMLADMGAAEMVLEENLDGKILAGVIRRLADSPETISKMEEKSEELGNVKAAKCIVDECLAMLGYTKQEKE